MDILPDNLDASHHWTEYEQGKASIPVEDIKFIWEPARLGWLFSLARAEVAGVSSAVGPRAWNLIEKFLEQNPVNCGPNWMNGQEVALRILALVFFHEVFQNNPDMPAGWQKTLMEAVIHHARRIPPTLVYARSQQNNHLLVEAAGLYTAGVFLPDFPEAAEWRKCGWEVFHQALADQIDDDGTYAQYSTNYHRLMLQIALWMKAVADRNGDEFPETSMTRLTAATNWLKGLISTETGHVPNYGHNDGAYIIPLTGQPYDDFRPVIRAADHFFLPDSSSEPADEMSLWFEWLADGRFKPIKVIKPLSQIQSYRKLVNGDSSAILFAPQINRRPGQADLLHTEIWHKGEPLLLDAGTFQYNAAPPWQNALAGTKVHNTLTVNRADQMSKAGRFLWLDWPKTWWKVDDLSAAQIIAGHDGYRRKKVLHERKVTTSNEKIWQVLDEVTPVRYGSNPTIEVCLHWLLPDLEWMVTQNGLQIGGDQTGFKMNIFLKANLSEVSIERQVIRAGELISSSSGQTVKPETISTLGWYSPTYGVKEPALSYRVIFRGKPSISIMTEFIVC